MAIQANKTIHTRLLAFQAELPLIGKEADNPFYKSKYASLESIQQAIQPLLQKHGLGYYFQPTAEGLHSVIFTEDGQTIEFDYPANLTGKPQEIGSAITYAKRYALCAMFGLIIGGEDDDGNEANQQKEAEVKQPEYFEKVTPEQASQIVKLLANPQTKGKGYAYYKKINHNTSIEPSDYDAIQSAIRLAYPNN